MNINTIRIDENPLYPREYKKPIFRTLKLEAYYRDVNNQWGSGLVELVEDDLAIQRQIANLLGTPIGTEHFEPMYGSDLPFRLMDPINEMMAYLIETDTFLAIHTWMRDRVVVDYTRSNIVELDTADGYLVNLYYLQLKDSKLVTYKFEIVR